MGSDETTNDTSESPVSVIVMVFVSMMMIVVTFRLVAFLGHESQSGGGYIPEHVATDSQWLGQSTCGRPISRASYSHKPSSFKMGSR
jgi:hypothetical protein